MQIAYLKGETGFGNNPVRKATWGIETYEGAIKLTRISGSMPLFENLMAATLSNPKIASLIREYQESNMDEGSLYKVVLQYGMSGAAKCFLKTLRVVNNCNIIRTKYLTGISMYGKVQDGTMSFQFREFIELASSIGLSDKTYVESLVKEAGVRYTEAEEPDEEFQIPSKLDI